MSLANVIKLVKEIAPQIAELQGIVKSIQAAEVKEGHTDIPAPKVDAPVEDEDPAKAGEQEEKKPEAAPAMDAAEIRRSVIQELGERDKLASQVSEFVGTFDHAHMGLREVAKYAAGKLGIPCIDGAEVVAVKAYLHNRKPDAPIGAMDSKASGDALAVIDQLFNKE
jgi:hypothetical protein